ncbi:MAG TPA: serine/threonine-protein kinase [Thermoanaerobaculia bacterium]|nr:serine/threonine-protein kinase [Thermoanaerobaculia bacterium]
MESDKTRWTGPDVGRRSASPPLESTLHEGWRASSRVDAFSAVGAVLGGYRILGRLGAGGMGQVFRARDDDLERDVALKLLHPKLTFQPHAMSRFRREARLLAAVHHPHIATIFGTFEDGGVRFLVMEVVDGETLAQRLDTGRMAVPEALDIARQIESALEAAHKKGIVHRDLKPANVMVSPEGWVKVLDFGLAKALSGEGESSSAPSEKTEETRAQGALGTAPYMSPEQLCGGETDWRIDVWAFGCVLFELLTGRRAFAGSSRTALVRAILDAEPPWSELPPELPAPVVNLLRRCLAKESHLRPSMRQVRTVLDEALTGLPKISNPAEADPTTLGIDPPIVALAAEIRKPRAGTLSLIHWVRQKPVGAIAAAGALVVALGVGLGLLGLATERTREGLIGLAPLSYAKSDLVLTGVQSLGSLPWRAVASLAAPHPVLRGYAFAGLVLAAALLAGGGFLRRGFRGTGALPPLAASAGVLLVGAWLYSAAIHTGLATPGAGRGLACEEQLSRRWDVSAAFETCTWLINDTPRNEGRRQGLGGVLGFLLLAAGGGAWMGARSQGLGPRVSWARWGLVAVHLVLALFFLRLVPAAHAYSTWGVRYPPVTLRTDLPGCDPALGQALASGSCCAFDVSEDATEGTVLLLWGSGCPGGAGFKAPQDVQAIGKGCLSQALTPQTVNSRCL